jgi:hypothetical protein
MTSLAGRYRLDEPVGRGGMAVVWRAYDEVLRRTVAVKVLSASRTERPPEDAVRREAMTAARLCHPRVAGIYDYGETEHDGRRQPFLVMEYVDGPTLAAHITDIGALQWREAATICAQVADALAAAHDNALVHRDIKPSNVMLSHSGVKVVDFGVATGAGEAVEDAAGRIWGTPGYLAPEQLQQGPALPSGDVYALGLVLFECLAGRPAWRSTKADDVLAQRARDPLPELPGHDELPEKLVQLYRRCLAVSPAERPLAGIVAETLRELATPAVAVRPHRPTPCSVDTSLPITRAHTRVTRPRRAAALVGAPLAAVAGIVGLQLAGPGTQQPAAQAGLPDGDAATEAACKAEYASLRLPDGTFTARLAVTNIGGGDLRNWSVRFLAPKHQRVIGVTGARWSQDNRIITLKAADLLPTGARTAMTLRGTFDQQHSGVPGIFSLDGVTCAQVITRVQTSSTPGPARPATAKGDSNGRGAVDEVVEDDDSDRRVPSSASDPVPSRTVTTEPTREPRPPSARPSGPVESSSTPNEPSSRPTSTPPDDEATESPGPPGPTGSTDTRPPDTAPTGEIDVDRDKLAAAVDALVAP